jgi:tetratricopeptide (TPR) repeat protein
VERIAPGLLVAVASVLAVSGATAQSRVTFTKNIAPILFDHCISCHRPGDIAPFSLLTYQDVRPRAVAMARATHARSMPPWKPEPGYGDELIGARRLDQPEIDLIQQWVDGGALEGDPADLQPPPAIARGWRLGEPDLIVQLPDPYALPAGGADILRNFVIPVPIRDGRYVRAVEFHPGNNRVVHHANIRIDRTRMSRQLDAADPGPGFDGRLTTAEFPEGHFLGWTPGQFPPPLPEGMAWRLDANSDLVVQLHLHPADTPQTVQPSIGFFFTNTPPDRTPLMLRLGRQNIDIAPGDREYDVRDSYVLPVDAEVYAVQPHAHFRARQVRGFALLPDGTRKWLIYIKDWDFNWQDVYRYAAPPALPKGTTLSMHYTYDNSSANRANPDSPPKRVRWGQNSADEMGDLWIQVLPRSGDDRERLQRDFGPKVIAEDAVGFESTLAADPHNPRLHEAAAALYLTLGRTARAIDHLENALRVDPGSVEGHYNLGWALASDGRADSAVQHFQRALSIQPDHVRARVNLGAVLRAQGRFDEAMLELRRALTLDPGNVAAHTNLGGALVATGDIAQAIAEYQTALASQTESLEVLVSLAWIFATSPDAAVRQPAEAVRLAERATALADRADVRVADTLAAAQAASGNFARALAIAEAALRNALAQGRARDADLLRARLDAYRRRMPYRDPGLAPR